MKIKEKIDFNSMLVDCLGCKWTIVLMEQIGKGINRPGKLVKSNDSLSTKVLNQCLKRMMEYKIIEKKSFSQIPPKVEYYLTPFGRELSKILSEIKSLQIKYLRS